MKNKIVIIAIALIALVCCCSFVAADSEPLELGNITASYFATSQSYSGAGNSFSIDSDGSISPNGNSVVDLNYEFTIDIDTSQISDDVKSKLEDSSSTEDVECDFTVSDGKSDYDFSDATCTVKVNDGTVTVSGEGMEMGATGIFVDLDNCEIVNCTIKFDDNGNITSFNAQTD